MEKSKRLLITAIFLVIAIIFLSLVLISLLIPPRIPAPYAGSEITAKCATVAVNPFYCNSSGAVKIAVVAGVPSGVTAVFFLSDGKNISSSLIESLNLSKPTIEIRVTGITQENPAVNVIVSPMITDSKGNIVGCRYGLKTICS